MAALYGHHTKQLRVFGWTPAAKAGFEVVVYMHGWSAAVQDGVQARAVFARDGGHMHMPCTCSHMPCTCSYMACTCSYMPIICHAPAHTWHVHVNVVVRAALCDGGLSHARQADRVRMAERQVWCAAPGHSLRAPLLRPQQSGGRWLDRTCGVRAKPLASRRSHVVCRRRQLRQRRGCAARLHGLRRRPARGGRGTAAHHRALDGQPHAPRRRPLAPPRLHARAERLTRRPVPSALARGRRRHARRR